MTEELKRLTPYDYATAIAVQDACNLSGVVFAFARTMQLICNEARINGESAEWRNNHPIAVLYASKIASLTRADHAFFAACDVCEKEGAR